MPRGGNSGRETTCGAISAGRTYQTAQGVNRGWICEIARPQSGRTALRRAGPSGHQIAWLQRTLRRCRLRTARRWGKPRGTIGRSRLRVDCRVRLQVPRSGHQLVHQPGAITRLVQERMEGGFTGFAHARAALTDRRDIGDGDPRRVHDTCRTDMCVGGELCSRRRFIRWKK
jgi:hypothetical protein